MGLIGHAEWAWLGGPGVEADVLLEVDGDRFTRVEAGVPAPAGVSRLPGLTLPGLANAHSHAFHRALRGRNHAGAGDFWAWREVMYRVAGPLDPDRYRALARACFAEMALAGITVVGEFHYLHHDPDGRPYAEPNVMAEALRSAAAEAGIRLTLLDALYLRAGFEGEPLDRVQARFSDGDTERWVERVTALADAWVGDPQARVGTAIHSVRAVDPRSMGRVAEVAAGREMPLHVHVSEQPAENQACYHAHGCSPTTLLEASGALGPRTTAVHATHVSQGDLDLLASAGSGVCLCPTTERDLADGIGPARAMAARGIQLSLGSDSHAVIDLFEEARAVELDERLASGTRAGSAAGGSASEAGERSVPATRAGSAVERRPAGAATGSGGPRSPGDGPVSGPERLSTVLGAGRAVGRDPGRRSTSHPVEVGTSAGSEAGVGTGPGGARRGSGSRYPASASRRGLDADRLLEAATLGGAGRLGWPELGRLAPGYLADFVTVGLGSVRLAGARPDDVVAAVVFAATAADVTDVVVGGRPIVRAGRHLLIDDIPRALARAIAGLGPGQDQGATNHG